MHQSSSAEDSSVVSHRPRLVPAGRRPLATVMRSETCRCAFASSAPGTKAAKPGVSRTREAESFFCVGTRRPAVTRLATATASAVTVGFRQSSLPPPVWDGPGERDIGKTPRQLQRSSERERMAETRGESARLGGRDGDGCSRVCQPLRFPYLGTARMPQRDASPGPAGCTGP